MFALVVEKRLPLWLFSVYMCAFVLVHVLLHAYEYCMWLCVDVYIQYAARVVMRRCVVTLFMSFRGLCQVIVAYFAVFKLPYRYARTPANK